MLPHVIITRSYCSPARLLPPLSWRGSGQGQTGRAGRTETEYYHWGESCFMLLSGQANLLGAPSRRLTGTLFEHSETSFMYTHTQASIKRNLHYPFFFPWLTYFKALHAFHRRMLYIHTQALTALLPLAHPPWRLRGQYLTLPPATLSSVTHSSHSIQTTGQPNKGDRRGAARAFRLHTHTNTHSERRPCELWHCSGLDGRFVLIHQPTPGS